MFTVTSDAITNKNYSSHLLQGNNNIKVIFTVCAYLTSSRISKAEFCVFLSCCIIRTSYTFFSINAHIHLDDCGNILKKICKKVILLYCNQTTCCYSVSYKDIWVKVLHSVCHNTFYIFNWKWLNQFLFLMHAPNERLLNLKTYSGIFKKWRRRLHKNSNEAIWNSSLTHLQDSKNKKDMFKKEGKKDKMQLEGFCK